MTTTPKKHMGLKAKERLSNTIIYILLITISIVWLIPFIFLVFESFRVESTYQVGYVVPKQFGLDNYINLFTKTDFPIWFKNTFIIGLFASVIQTIIVLCMSYTLSRLRFKGRKLLMNVMLVLGFFPGFLSMIILYKVLSWFNLTSANSVPGLILVYVASSGMGYYVSKGFFDTISRSLDEAARVDGATRFQVFTKIIMPLSKPIVIYTILTAFMAPWGDFMFAKYISHATSAGMNVAVGLQYLISTPQNLSAYYTMFCAGGVLVAIPITILFMCLQRYYVEGVTGGAVKG
ncbi:MAG: ABC transporter permease subunit [Erysipelotrichaceae bacterium]|nr:ABC transporter permease subunit [Erysipelotrichaceae bacterium]